MSSIHDRAGGTRGVAGANDSLRFGMNLKNALSHKMTFYYWFSSQRSPDLGRFRSKTFFIKMTFYFCSSTKGRRKQDYSIEYYCVPPNFLDLLPSLCTYYVGPLGKEVDWLIHLWHAISLSASPLYYGRVWVRLLQPHCTYLHYYIMEPNPLWNSHFVLNI